VLEAGLLMLLLAIRLLEAVGEMLWRMRWRSGRRRRKLWTRADAPGGSLLLVEILKDKNMLKRLDKVLMSS
jgi:hypothetical protein